MEKLKVNLGFERFPVRFTGEGENLSPPFEVVGVNGCCMAIIVDDPDAPAGTWVHWVIWNMPIVAHVPEGVPKDKALELPFSAKQGTNSGNKTGYDGPYPPKGHGTHHYFFKVYVLDRHLDLHPGAMKSDLVKAMEGHILQYGEAIGTYSR
jgi:Raf kinase inhibitor-like YbhB/YbcL family protein